MKRIYTLLFLVLVFPVLAGVAYAQTATASASPSAMREGEIVTLGKNEVINRDFFAGGEVIELYGTVNGDVYIGGGQVTIEGIVNGDVLVGGGDVTIAGVVAEDVRAAGGNILFAGDVGGNVTAVGGNITFSKAARMGGSIVTGGGNVDLQSSVAGNIVGGVGNLIIASAIDGDVEVATGTLRVRPDARISGNLSYSSEEDAQIDSAAQIGGQVVQKSHSKVAQDIPDKEAIQKGMRDALFTFKLITFLAAVVIGFILTKVAPVFSTQLGKTITTSPWKSVGFGFLVLIGMPIAGLLLLITIIGLPIGIGLLLLYPLCIYMAKFPVSMWVGQKLGPSIQKDMGTTTMMLIGLVALYVVSMLPIIGGIAGFLTLLFGLGASTLTKLQTYKTLKGKKLI